ncbi:MAG: C45 family autoproteolytic acyltransferase/hydrolase [Smithellaceae bacterium]
MKVRAVAIVVSLLMSIALSLPVFAEGEIKYQKPFQGGSLLALPVFAAQEMKHQESFEGGNLYRVGEVRVLELTGNYRQMGRQYGALAKDDLQAMHTTIGKVFLDNPDKKRRMTEEELNTIARSLFNRYPQRYKEIIYGMAETSGLGLDKILLVNALEWFPKINKLSYGKCSGIAVWGPYTRGQVIFGRNDDDAQEYLDFARPVVAVFKPNDGSIPAALINYPGVIYNATGMNANGLFIELNAGNEMGFSLDRVSIFTTLFSYLQEYSNLVDLDRAMRSTLVDMSSIITVADPTRGYSYECSLWDTKRRDQDSEGIIAAANEYSHPDWNITPLDPKKDSGANRLRKDNLLKLGAKYKGAITPEVMMQKIMDVDIKNGGATHAGTIFQVVAAPADRKIWVKVPGRVEWTEVPLETIFQKK